MTVHTDVVTLRADISGLLNYRANSLAAKHIVYIWSDGVRSLRALQSHWKWSTSVMANEYPHDCEEVFEKDKTTFGNWSHFEFQGWHSEIVYEKEMPVLAVNIL